MNTFQQQLESIRGPAEALKHRRGLYAKIEQITGRKLLVYAADFAKSNMASPNTIDIMDKVGFSDLVEGLRGEPIDVLIHSPGGSVEAAEGIVNILRDVAPSVRFIVPHSAKSAATMMALSGDSILMDHRSELGPIDPQVAMPLEHGGVRWVPAQTILDGFSKARSVIEDEGPRAIPAFMPLINKYDLHLLEICQNAKDLACNLVKVWLAKYMFKDEDDANQKAEAIANRLADYNSFLSHGRPIAIEQAIDLGIKVEDLRKTPELQALIWELYCAIEHHFVHTPAVKLFENGYGVTWGRNVPVVEVQQVHEIPAPARLKNVKPDKRKRR